MASSHGEVFEEQCCDPSAVVGVIDGERDLGLVATGQAVVSGDGDHHVVEDQDEGLAVVVVDVREPLYLAGDSFGWALKNR